MSLQTTAENRQWLCRLLCWTYFSGARLSATTTYVRDSVVGEVSFLLRHFAEIVYAAAPCCAESAQW